MLVFVIGFILLGLVLAILSALIRELPGGRVIISLSYLGGVLGLGWLMAFLIDGRPFGDFGFHLGNRWFQDFLFGLLLGAALMTGIFLVEHRAGWIVISARERPAEESSGPVELFVSLIGFIAIGFAEEFFFRGYQLRNLAEGLCGRKIGPRLAIWTAWIFTSALFGVAHAANPNATPVAVANIFFAGFVLGLPYLLTGELAMAIGIHITWNLFQGPVFGFPVSGTTPHGIITLEQGGPELWTGGNFGPEAGLLTIISLAVGCPLILIWVKGRQGEVALQTVIAEFHDRRPLADATLAVLDSPSLDRHS
jgi:membrane protease YdiL (CAAX protease family)